MAKGKDKKAGIPKEGADGKVRKKLRKAGKKALKLAEQPIVSEVVAAAMMAAAAALSDGKSVKRTARKAAGAAEEMGVEASKFADNLRMLAIDVARRTLEAWEKKSDSKTKSGSAGPGEGGAPGRST